MITKNKNHVHDCSTCIYLGSDKEYDYYFHPNKDAFWSEFIARNGEDGDYYCGNEFLMSNVYLNTALRLAFKQNLLNKEVIEHLKMMQQQWFSSVESESNKEYKKAIELRWQEAKQERFILN
jgi:hypothetical protein